MIETLVIYARLAPGGTVSSRHGWLYLLATGWNFSDPLHPQPLSGTHGAYSVLMLKQT